MDGWTPDCYIMLSARSNQRNKEHAMYEADDKHQQEVSIC